MKYVFEIYENTPERGRTFLGYKTVNAESTEDARLSVLSGVPESYIACQIWVPQES